MTYSDEKWIGLGLIIVGVLGFGSNRLFDKFDRWRDRFRSRMAGPECGCHACEAIDGGTE